MKRGPQQSSKQQTQRKRSDYKPSVLQQRATEVAKAWKVDAYASEAAFEEAVTKARASACMSHYSTHWSNHISRMCSNVSSFALNARSECRARNEHNLSVAVKAAEREGQASDAQQGAAAAASQQVAPADDQQAAPADGERAATADADAGTYADAVTLPVSENVRRSATWADCGTVFLITVSPSGSMKAAGSEAAFQNPSSAAHLMQMGLDMHRAYNQAIYRRWLAEGEVPDCVKGKLSYSSEVLQAVGTAQTGLSLARQLLCNVSQRIEDEAKTSVQRQPHEQLLASLHTAGNDNLHSFQPS